MTSIERQRIDLKQEMVDYLEAQGIAGTSGITGNKLADEIAEVVLRDCLDLSADAVEDASEFQEFDLIIAFAFGHRFEANGNRAPGPVNERLAREVERRYQARPRENRPRVWAQWEVGECLRGSVVETEGSLHVVHPEISVRRDTVAYASTISVAESVRASLSTDSRHCALVVAHPDHLRRCVWAVNDQGIEARGARPGWDDLADWYDAGSGQAWTQVRHLYLLHDMLGALRLSRERAGLAWDAVQLEDIKVRHTAVVRDAAFGTPQPETTTRTQPGIGEVLSPSQLAFIAHMLRYGDRITRFELEELSIFTPTSNHGCAKLVMQYERAGRTARHVLYDGGTPREGIRGVDTRRWSVLATW